jgi:NADH:ubiquinone oxidoreductase subunit 2 (subunit N)
MNVTKHSTVLLNKIPLLAFVLAVSMLSLAGIPLTAGFWGKFFIFTSAAERGIMWITVIAVLMSTVGIYYYFRVIISSYLQRGRHGKDPRCAVLSDHPRTRHIPDDPVRSGARDF